MEKYHVLLGEFAFIEGDCIIIRIDDIQEVQKNHLDVFCEESLDNYEGYLIPELFHGKISLNA